MIFSCSIAILSALSEKILHKLSLGNINTFDAVFGITGAPLLKSRCSNNLYFIYDIGSARSNTTVEDENLKIFLTSSGA